MLYQNCFAVNEKASEDILLRSASNNNSDITSPSTPYIFKT